MNRVRVMIAGKEYVLQTVEEEKYVIDLAKKLDKGIKDIMAGNDSLSLTSACILMAMDVLDEKAKLSAESDNLRFQVKDYIDEATKANQKVDELEKKVQTLESENKELWNEIELYSLKEKLDHE